VSDTLKKNRHAMGRFLESLRETGNVRLACEAAGKPRRTVYNWRDRWTTFEDEWDDALEDACDTLEREAWIRATEGQSDRLLMFLLKAHRPNKFKERAAVEHTGEAGGPIIQVREIVVEKHNDESVED